MSPREKLIYLAMLLVAAWLFYKAAKRAVTSERHRVRYLKPRDYDQWSEWQ